MKATEKATVYQAAQFREAYLKAVNEIIEQPEPNGILKRAWTVLSRLWSKTKRNDLDFEKWHRLEYRTPSSIQRRSYFD
jgi:hypothetical protein